MPQVKLIITGSRLGTDGFDHAMHAYLRMFGAPSKVILGGDENHNTRSRRGTDDQAYQFFCWQKLESRIITEWANWDTGNGAGPDRNERMSMHAGAGDHCLGFPAKGKSTGTRGCMALCEKRFLLTVDATQSGWLELLWEMHTERHGE